PRGNGKTGSGTASKPPAKSAGKPKPATATKPRAPRRRPNEDGNRAAKKPAAAKTPPAQRPEREPDFEHHQVDEHSGAVAAGLKERLTEDQRVLLGDLFAVVE